MNRRHFFQAGAGAALLGALPAGAVARPAAPALPRPYTLSGHAFLHPLAITMWDFSWLERRWLGGGYEDWDQALDELKLRGYDAVRIDAYPHLVSVDPSRTWEIIPEWTTQDWGSQAINRVQVQPALNEFIEKCAVRDIWVGLSTWFQEDSEKTYQRIRRPADLAEAWRKTLASIESAGLLDRILYVDLLNEWPIEPWTPFFTAEERNDRANIARWEREALDAIKSHYPTLDYTFSGWPIPEPEKQDFSRYDVFDLHMWMAQSEFYKIIDYNYERFDNKGYENIARKAAALYRERPDHWKSVLKGYIEQAARQSEVAGKPLITTECWAIVDYKDWPLLEWDWVKELCAYGVEEAAATGRWVAIATSNFCGPQFTGMWRDVAWHQRLTHLIHTAGVDEALRSA